MRPLLHFRSVILSHAKDPGLPLVMTASAGSFAALKMTLRECLGWFGNLTGRYAGNFCASQS
jgi:hypothetical protein